MNKRVIPIRLSSVFILCIFSYFVFLPASAFSACPETMTSYWKLDDELAVPQSYLNEIEPNFDGECAGACPSLDNIDPAVGEGAQEFDGSTTGINIPASATSAAPFDWAATDSFTIEVWIKRASGISAVEVVVGRDDSSTSLRWWIGLTDTGAASFNLRDVANQASTSVDGTTSLANGQWHHIMAVRDAVQGKNLLYVDGQEVGSADIIYPPAGNGFTSSTAPMNIGWLSRTNGFHFNGVIDEVALYNVALPQRIAERHFILGKPYCEVSSPGVFRKGAWYLDANGTGQWEPGTDTALPVGSFGLPTDIPITGDWNGDGYSEIGVFRNGAWYLDVNGNGQWNSGVDTALPVGSFGLPTDIPITGDWNGDGITNIGVFRNGAWYLDFNGNGQWDLGVDIALPVGSFGLPNDMPITGVWRVLTVPN